MEKHSQYHKYATFSANGWHSTSQHSQPITSQPASQAIPVIIAVLVCVIVAGLLMLGILPV